VRAVKRLADGTRCVIADAGTNLLPGALWRWPRVEAVAAGDGATTPALVAGPLNLVADVVHPAADLPALDEGERDGLAGLLVDILGRLDALFDAPMPYMLWIHQRPSDGGEWRGAHVHVEISPLYRAPGTPRYVAAGELGSGVLFNPVDPEDAARRLRAAGGGRA
jgi:UDPglucose--hexose-1-phosphate uridylyltransferase